ncbi:MAG: hypothetical protein A4E20_13985 [Nitrospira sp. SG-bin2]|nr:MAG: hypothetical protein A4E20_13985 [Nitrospira sp. SG-bin2]
MCAASGAGPGVIGEAVGAVVTEDDVIEQGDAEELAGLPEGPDCTGSTVTACWRGLCGTAGLKRTAGHARENVRAANGQCQG